MGMSSTHEPHTMTAPHDVPSTIGGPGFGLFTAQEDQLSSNSEQRISKIIKIMEAPEGGDLIRAMRLLAIEIAESLDHGAYQVFTAKAVNDRIKNLCILSRQIQQTAEISDRDSINFDGPAFKYVLMELTNILKSSVHDAGFTEDDTNHILRVFRDNLKMREPDLRREVAKMGKGTSANKV